jgi:hypothetical protein
MKLLQTNWMIVVAGTLLYWAVTAVLLLRFDPPAVVAAHAGSAEASWEKGPSWEFHNPELDRLVEELKEEKASVAQRAEQLRLLEQRLQAERTEINQVTQMVHQLQMEFEKNFLSVRGEEAANLKKIVKLFSAMDPETTVSLFQEMTDDEVVKYLMIMKDADSAAILETLARQGEEETRRVTLWTERLKAALYRSALTNQSLSAP